MAVAPPGLLSPSRFMRDLGGGPCLLPCVTELMLLLDTVLPPVTVLLASLPTVDTGVRLAGV